MVPGFGVVGDFGQMHDGVRQMLVVFTRDDFGQQRKDFRMGIKRFQQQHTDQTKTRPIEIDRRHCGGRFSQEQ